MILLCFCCFKKKKRNRDRNRNSNSNNNRNVNSVRRAKSSSVGRRNEKPREEFGGEVQEAENNKMVFFEGCSNNFDLEDLLRASAEVLGKGTFGTTYKATLEESVTVVVKRLKDVAGKKEFEQQMEMIGRVEPHPNVVPLRAYYYSKDEKLLVYDYISTGSLLTLLHGCVPNLQEGNMMETVFNFPWCKDRPIVLGSRFKDAFQDANSFYDVDCGARFREREICSGV